MTPDNFWYFLVLFSLALYSGAYLLYAYYTNWLLILNAVVLTLFGLRAASEYYIQQLETYAEVVAWAPYHILPATLGASLQWFMLYFYVKPIRHRWWKVVAGILTFCFVMGPYIGHIYYTSIDPQIFSFLPERIAGYWQYKVNTDFWYYGFYRTHVNLSLVWVLVILIVGIVQDPRRRLLRALLVASYIGVYILYIATSIQGETNIPDLAGLFLVHGIIVTWYVSNYRLYRGNLSLIAGDLMESVSDLVIATDKNWKITQTNQQTKLALDLQQNNLIGWLSEQLQAAKEEVLQTVHRLSAGRGHEELSIANTSGELRNYQLKVAPFTNGDDLLGYTFLLTDVTDIRAAEKKLQELNATKDRLFAIIGHDLRKPALTFRGVGEKVNYLLENKDYTRLAILSDKLDHAAFNLNSLLDNLLKWALQQRGMLVYKPRTVILTDISQDLAEHLRETAREKGVELQTDVPPAAVIQADPNAITTILRNLLDNAIKFTPPEGMVSLSATVREGTVAITVSDTGCGMPPSALEEFNRTRHISSQADTAGNKGTGIGLNLTYELVRLNRGELRLESDPDVGTSVHLRFPASAPGDVQSSL